MAVIDVRLDVSEVLHFLDTVKDLIEQAEDSHNVYLAKILRYAMENMEIISQSLESEDAKTLSIKLLVK